MFRAICFSTLLSLALIVLITAGLAVIAVSIAPYSLNGWNEHAFILLFLYAPTIILMFVLAFARPLWSIIRPLQGRWSIADKEEWVVTQCTAFVIRIAILALALSIALLADASVESRRILVTVLVFAINITASTIGDAKILRKQILSSIRWSALLLALILASDLTVRYWSDISAYLTSLFDPATTTVFNYAVEHPSVLLVPIILKIVWDVRKTRKLVERMARRL